MTSFEKMSLEQVVESYNRSCDRGWQVPNSKAGTGVNFLWSDVDVDEDETQAATQSKVGSDLDGSDLVENDEQWQEEDHNDFVKDCEKKGDLIESQGQLQSDPVTCQAEVEDKEMQAEQRDAFQSPEEQVSQKDDAETCSQEQTWPPVVEKLAKPEHKAVDSKPKRTQLKTPTKRDVERTNSRCMLFGASKQPTKVETKEAVQAPEALCLDTDFPSLKADPKLQKRMDDFKKVQTMILEKKARQDAENALRKAREDARRAERTAKEKKERQQRLAREEKERRERAARDEKQRRERAAQGEKHGQKPRQQTTSNTTHSKTGRGYVGELVNPQAGGRVHFSGLLMWDEQVSATCSLPYLEDQYSEYVGEGRYSSNMTAFPKAIRSTFDGVAVDAGTRVVIYSEPNFKGKVLWDRVGPAIVCNTIFKDHTHHAFKGKKFHQVFKGEWEGDLNTIFPPEVREFSCCDMHKWNTGSLVISGGNSIPQELDVLDEYKLLSNPRY